MLPFVNYNILTPTTMSESKTIIRSNNNDYKKRNKRWPATIYTGGGGGGGGDELAVVKAAAWAWYQRNEGKPMMKEFDFTPKATREPRPSRYKLEAENKMILNRNKVSMLSLWYTDHLLREDQDTGRSTLLDPYEIKSISKRIDDSLPSDPTSVLRHDHKYDYIYDDHDFLQKKLEYDSSYNGKESTGMVKKVNKKSLWIGMILMTPRTVCGRRGDVDLLAHRAARKTIKVTAAAAASVKTRIGRR